MKKVLIASVIIAISSLATAQVPHIPHKASEDAEHVMSQAYWEIWNDEQQARIDADIETYRKADAVFKTGRIKSGTVVNVEQISSSFVFGASAFNWNQLGDSRSNETYRNLFGSLFNRATVPFYWKEYEFKPGCPRDDAGIYDTEEWWNTARNPMRQPHWRRPAPGPIVDWCNERGVAVHGHPLTWGSRKWHYPQWLQYDGIPQVEKEALDTLELLCFSTRSVSCLNYESMTPSEIAALVPTYLQRQEQRTLQRIRDIMSKFDGRVQSWDVVNESARDFGLGVLDPSLPMCKSYYGIMFSDYTFKSMKEAESCNGSGALLNINDYIVDDRFVSQAGGLVARGAKVDVFGSQMHLFDPQECLDIAAGKHIDPKEKLVEPEPIREFFGRLGKWGVPTCLSEITITSAGDGHRGEMIQAIITRNLYRMWFSLPSMMGITWWNIVDNCGAPSEPVISGIYHRDMTPKYAFWALDELINHEWRTNLELKPDSKGNVSWRGFKGRYKISWTDRKGLVHEQIVEVN